MSTPPPAARHEPTLSDPLAEARRLIEMADAAGLQLRLMGGLAFHAAVPSWRAPIERAGRDLDLVTRSGDRSAVGELLVAAGYQPDRQYNALYGHKQLYFTDPQRARPVDVIVDRLAMCHTLELTDRLAAQHPTLPYADLLLSKLQVVRINKKDILDALVLLQASDLSETDAGAINVSRVTAITSRDWGWWRTVTGNLSRLAAYVDEELAADELATGEPPRHDPTAQIEALRSALDAAPKSFAWRVRARIGERVRWYEEPEEVAHGAS